MNNGEQIYSEEQLKEFFHEQKKNQAETISMKYVWIMKELAKLKLPKQSTAICLLSLNVACANEIVDLFRGDTTKTIETGISTIHINETVKIDEEKVVEILQKLIEKEKNR
jgi:hypothetical protein